MEYVWRHGLLLDNVFRTDTFQTTHTVKLFKSH